MKRILIWTIALALLLLGGCRTGYAQEPLPPEPEEEPTVSEPPPVYSGPEHPLTGLPTEEDLSQLRPFAISINNLKQAQPQQGVAEADIIYEVLAEGGITRMIALYQDVSDLGVVGSIRSARPYFLDIVQGHDAVFIHAGGSEEAYRLLAQRKIDHIDGVRGKGNMFFRDAERKARKGYEHSLMTSGELIRELAGSYGFSLEHAAGYRAPMRFADEIELPGAAAASEISVRFSSYKTGLFHYDPETALYQLSQYGAAYLDGNSDTQVTAKNVLVLFAETKTLDSVGRLSVALTGSGSGYFALEGESVPIRWSKPSAEAPFSYSFEHGAPLYFGRGTSYICIVPLNAEVSFAPAETE